jgi:O-antigen/teichoic acid export membrane protein
VGIRLLTELLPKGQYGLLVLFMGASGLFAMTFMGPLLQAAARFYHDTGTAPEADVYCATSRRLIRDSVGIAAVVAVPACALHYWYSGKVPLPAYAAFLLLLAATVAMSLETYLLPQALRQRRAALVAIAQTWLQPALAAGLILVWTRSAEACLLGYAAALFLTVGISSLFRRGRVSLLQCGEGRPDRKLRKTMLIYALPLLPAAAAGWGSSLSHRYILEGFLGSEEVGVYAACHGLASRPFLFIGGILSGVFLPRLFAAVAQGDRRRARSLTFGWFLLLLVVTCLVVLLVSCFRDWLAWLLLAEPYRAGVPYVPIIAAGYGAMLMRLPFLGLLFAHKKTTAFMVLALVSCGLNVTLNFLLIPRIGAAGAAYATLVTSVFLASAIAAVAIRLVPIRGQGA